MIRYLPIFILISFINAEDWVVNLNKKYSPAVVTVICYDIFNEQIGHGSGFNVDESGIIVTNEHVVSNPSIAKVKIKFQNDEIFEVRGVLYESKSKDLAFLKIDGFDLPIVKLGNSNDVEPGEKVVAIGSPLTTDLSGSITDGIISQIRELDGTKYFQMTANINRGNSGGPLFNKKGEVIAVNTLGNSTENLFFSVTINYVRGALPNSKRIIREFSPENAKIPNTGRVNFISDLDSVKVILTILDTVDLDYGFLPADIPPLPVGGYKYIAVKPRYGYVEGDFYIAKGRTTEEKIKIEKNLSKIEFISNEKDVDVFVNDKYYGKTPHVEFVRSGKYSVRGKKDDFEDIVTDFYLTPGNDKMVSLDFISLNVNTTPSGADVWFNGNWSITPTPIEFNNLKAGKDTLVIKKAGYFSIDTLISIEKENPNICNISLIESSLEINTSPEGAMVYFEGKYEGSTPLTIDIGGNATSKRKVIRIEKDAYLDTTIRIKNNKKLKPLYVHLEKSSFLTIKGDENIANSKIIFKKKGEVYKRISPSFRNTIKNIRLEPGVYSLIVKKSGFKSFEKVILIGREDNQIIDVALEVSGGVLNVYRVNNHKSIKEEFPPKTVFKIRHGGSEDFKDLGQDRKDGFSHSWELTPGDYELMIDRDNHATYKKKFLILPNEVTYIGAVLLSYEKIKSIKKEIKSLKLKRNLSFVTSPLLLGAGIFFLSTADDKYKEYQVAGSDADEIRKQVELNDMYSSALFGSAGLGILPAMYYQDKVRRLEQTLPR